jgi:hypothetical protein
MDIFKDTTGSDSTDLLEIDRFKAKIYEIWMRMLKETYAQYYDVEDEDTPSLEEFLKENELKFSNEPEPETELDTLMDMLDSLMDDKEEKVSFPDEDEDIKERKFTGKAPSYGTTTLKANNESGKKEKTSYEYNHKTTKTPTESRTRSKGGSYEGTHTGQISKRKDAKVITKYSPLVKEIKDELIALSARQKIGRRKMRFRL